MRTIYFFLLLFIKSSLIFSQKTNSIEKKDAIVYFTRASSLGALVNFTYFDGDSPIGRFNGPKYIKYQCKPGKHLFWARSENKSYVEADLEAGKIYLIDVIPQMGIVKAGVKLLPVDKKRYKLKRIQKLVTKKESMKFAEQELVALKQEMESVIKRGLAKYEQMKSKGQTISELTKEMTILDQDFAYVKKKKK